MRSPPPNAPRVLVVDDELHLLRAYRRMLGQHYELVTAASGHAAEELVEASDFDAIISDLVMPDGDGPTLYERVAELRPGLERRIVFVSGGVFGERARTFLEGVDNPRLDKPFGMEDLQRIVDALVAARG